MRYNIAIPQCYRNTKFRSPRIHVVSRRIIIFCLSRTIIIRRRDERLVMSGVAPGHRRPAPLQQASVVRCDIVYRLLPFLFYMRVYAQCFMQFLSRRNNYFAVDVRALTAAAGRHVAAFRVKCAGKTKTPEVKNVFRGTQTASTAGPPTD